MLDRLELPEPWHGDIEAALRLIDGIDAEIGGSTTSWSARQSNTEMFLC